ncbi:MAG: hypothetical protein ACK56W_24330 [Pirellula sp.]|jgi:hypothetical protein
MNAWVRKEIKDSIRWLPIGMVLMVALIWYLLASQSPNFFAWRAESLFTLAWFVSAIFATFLGLANYLPETWGSARGFLVQRGLSLHRIFVIRAVVNLAVYLIAMLVPLGALAVFRFVIGTTTAPVSPIQVVPSVVVVLFSFSFYFGAIAVACRPCRWYGSRLFPLLASLAVPLAAVPILSLPKMLIVCVFAFSLGIIGMLLLAASSRVAFLRGPSQPAPSRTRNISLYEKCMMLAAVLVATVLVAVFFASIFNNSYSRVYHSVGFTKEGMPWLIETRYIVKNGSGEQLHEAKFAISESSEDVDSKPDVQALMQGIGFSYPWNYSENFWDMKYVGSFTSADGYPLHVMGFRGLLYVYQLDALQHSRLIAVVGKELVGDAGMQQAPFEQTPRLLTNGSNYPPVLTGLAFSDRNPSSTRKPLGAGSFTIAATDGIYYVDLDTSKIKRLLDSNVRAYSYSSVANGTSDSNKLAVWDGSSISMFQCEGSALNGPFQIGERITTLSTPTDFGSKLQSGDVQFDYRDPDNWAIAIGYSRRNMVKQKVEVARSIQKEIQHYTTTIPESLSVVNLNAMKREVLIAGSSIPPIVLATTGTIAYLLGDEIPELFSYLRFLVAQALLSGIMATLAARWRGLSARQVASWCAGGFLIGLGTWFLVLSIYPRAVYTKCPACNRNRRIEGEKCESCGADWEPLTPLGIEVFEQKNLDAEAIEDRIVLSQST